MATISNTPRPGYAWDATDNCWYPIGTGPHTHADYITSSSAINPTIVDAKGDIIAATAADTVARLAVGNNGETLVADSSTATGLRYNPSRAAGRNALINGGFDIWQRSTSAATSTGTYPAPDRWWAYTNSGSATFARESTIIPSGALYAGKITATASSTQVFFAQAIETANVAPFINKTVTVSGQLAASTTVAHNLLVQYSTTVDDSNSGSWTTITASTTSGSLTPTSTTYVSFANTYAIPSNAKSLRVGFEQTSAIANGVVCYYGNIQLELGSVATTFSRAGGTIGGELIACQRYYTKSYNQSVVPGTADTQGKIRTYSGAESTGALGITIYIPPMRTAPTVTSYDDLGASGKCFKGGNGKDATIGSVSNTSLEVVCLDATNTREFYFYFTASAEL